MQVCCKGIISGTIFGPPGLGPHLSGFDANRDGPPSQLEKGIAPVPSLVLALAKLSRNDRLIPVTIQK